MDFKKVLINGKLISEAILNGIYASIIGIPIVLATGCDVFCEEIKKEIG
ncbi:MAG: M55 family metallopeptidase, partial [Methanobrevibacter sp.]|nr:M55 family metallopeptidase [Methanobrevibacter sp.]